MKIVEDRVITLAFKDIEPGMVFCSEGTYWLKTTDLRNAVSLADGTIDPFYEEKLVAPCPTAKVIFD